MNRQDKRFFAAKAAMQGCLSAFAGVDALLPTARDVAQESVCYADALLEALGESEGSSIDGTVVRSGEGGAFDELTVRVPRGVVNDDTLGRSVRVVFDKG